MNNIYQLTADGWETSIYVVAESVIDAIKKWQEFRKSKITGIHLFASPIAANDVFLSNANAQDAWEYWWMKDGKAPINHITCSNCEKDYDYSKVKDIPKKCPNCGFNGIE